MEAIFFAILALIAVFRAMFRLARWVRRSFSPPGAAGGPPSPPQPMAVQPAAVSQTAAGAATRPPQQRPAPRTILPPPIVPPAANSTGVQARDVTPPEDETLLVDRPTAGASVEPQGLTGSLFGTTSDLLRAFILQEVLGPPLSQRKRNPNHRH